jgi:hypothetical protein
LDRCQRRPLQTQLCCAAWFFFLSSMFMPAVEVFGSHSGWEAADTCFKYVLRPLAREEVKDWSYYTLNCLFALANLLLACSPLLLWRLRHGKGSIYGALFVTSAAAMWCALTTKIGPLIGFVVWCSAGLAVLCAFRMRWAMLPLTAVAPLLACMSR